MFAKECRFFDEQPTVRVTYRAKIKMNGNTRIGKRRGSCRLVLVNKGWNTPYTIDGHQEGKCKPLLQGTEKEKPAGKKKRHLDIVHKTLLHQSSGYHRQQRQR